MTDRDIAIARAAVDAAATICNRQHHRMDLPRDYRYAAGVFESYIRELDLPSIVAGVECKQASDCASPIGCEMEGKCVIALLRARVAELEAEVARANVVEDMWRNEALRAQQALVDERARVAELEQDAARYRHMKSNATFQNRNGPGLYWYLPRYNRELPIGERLDAAIDAAMREGK